MQLFVKGIIDSTKATFRRWRRAIPQLFNLDGNVGFGADVAISGDGTTICVYKPSVITSTNNVANVIVYKILPDGSSIQVGQTFSHSGRPINFGSACALNFNGTRLAISSPFFNRLNSSASYTGRVQIYDLVNNQWNLIGTILGTNGTSNRNFNISFNASGSRIGFYTGFTAITSQSSIRYFQIYDFNGTDWVQVGSTLQNPTSQNSRDSISLNANGNFVATTNKVFEFQSTDWVEIGNFPVISTNTGAPFYYLQYNIPNLIALNETGDKLVILYVEDPQTSAYANSSFVEIYHRISNAWVFKVKKAIPNWTGVSVNIQGVSTPIIIEGIAFPKFAKDGNRVLLSGTYVDENQIVLPSNSSVIASRCVICDYDSATNQLTEDSQILYSVRSSITEGACADISKDGKTFVFGKPNDARIGSINQLQRYGVADVFRKELD